MGAAAAVECPPRVRGHRRPQQPAGPTRGKWFVKCSPVALRNAPDLFAFPRLMTAAPVKGKKGKRKIVVGVVLGNEALCHPFFSGHSGVTSCQQNLVSFFTWGLSLQDTLVNGSETPSSADA